MKTMCSRWLVIVGSENDGTCMYSLVSLGVLL